MGMLTFGLIMLFGNLAFIEPDFWGKCCGAAMLRESPDERSVVSPTAAESPSAAS